MITRVQLKLADGTLVAGAVHGSGGLIAGARGPDRIEAAIRNATKGRPTGLYEPAPGHARLYRDVSTLAANGEIDVDLRGASIVSTIDREPIRVAGKEQA